MTRTHMDTKEIILKLTAELNAINLKPVEDEPKLGQVYYSPNRSSSFWAAVDTHIWNRSLTDLIRFKKNDVYLEKETLLKQRQLFSDIARLEFGFEPFYLEKTN